MDKSTELLVILLFGAVVGLFKLWAMVGDLETRLRFSLKMLEYARASPKKRQDLRDKESSAWCYWNRRCLAITRYWRRPKNLRRIRWQIGQLYYRVIPQAEYWGFSLKFHKNHPAWMALHHRKKVIDGFDSIEQNHDPIDF